VQGQDFTWACRAIRVARYTLHHLRRSLASAEIGDVVVVYLYKSCNNSFE
jgi:hypothetical protein